MATPKVTRRAFVLGGAAAAAAVALPAWTAAAANRASGYARLMRELRAATRGPVVTRQNAGLMVAAQIWNQRFDGRRPYGVLYAVDDRDVQQAVRWAARSAGCPKLLSSRRTSVSPRAFHKLQASNINSASTSPPPKPSASAPIW
jgi:hypothetical protein